MWPESHIQVCAQGVTAASAAGEGESETERERESMRETAALSERL